MSIRMITSLAARSFLLILLLATAVHAQTKRYNGTGNEVILQGFHWTSYEPELNGNKRWYKIIKENAAEISKAGFDYVWFPPPSASAAADSPYMPNQWFLFSNGYGNETQLKAAIKALSNRHVGAICDIVINHRCGTATAGADFTNPSFGSPDDNAAAVVSDDECHCGTGNGEEWHQDGIHCDNDTTAGRDLDHTDPKVQEQVKAYEQKLKALGFVGWRYDEVKGYRGNHVGDYNDASDPVLSVGEYYDDDSPQHIIDWIDESGGRSMAFDFPTRKALLGATLGTNYSGLKTIAGKPPGVIGFWSEMAVTFVENHDTEPAREMGRKQFTADKVMQGYVYILTHPGIPCVFWRHYFDYGDRQKQQIRQLIKIRKDAGINSRSIVNIDPNNTQGKYAAVIDGTVAMKIGPAPWSPGDGWKVALDGPDYAVWTKQR